jgi:hypothetical protein
MGTGSWPAEADRTPSSRQVGDAGADALSESLSGDETRSKAHGQIGLRGIGGAV